MLFAFRGAQDIRLNSGEEFNVFLELKYNNKENYKKIKIGTLNITEVILKEIADEHSVFIDSDGDINTMYPRK